MTSSLTDSCLASIPAIAAVPGVTLPRILALSSSLLTDRMLFHSRCLRDLSCRSEVRVWATTADRTRFEDVASPSPVTVEPFPAVNPFKEFPYNYLRRFNEFVWDYRLRPPSRLSQRRHLDDKALSPYVRALKAPARALALAGVEQPLEDWIGKLLLSYLRSAEALERLRTSEPAVVIATGPHRFEEPAVVALAQKLGVSTMALITSWDNLSIKKRMIYKYDGYLVWSEQMKRELHYYYPHSRRVPTYVVGAPQFDVFFAGRFQQSREAFCASQGLRPERPIIVYALGSPNLLREYHGALYLAGRVAKGDLGDVQLLVRPHPGFDKGHEAETLRHFDSRVVVQRTATQSQNERQILEWVNTFRHADVVVNLSSTVTVDAAFFDRPVVNLDYDPEPGQPNQSLVKDINHVWTHFKPLAESGGVWLVNNPEELVEAVKTYLVRPELHRERRHWIPEYVCGYTDGRSGQRLAEAILDFVYHHARSRTRVN